MTKRFSLKLASLKPGITYVSLSFGAYVEGTNPFSDAILESVCGPETNYGHLLAYCFRRFGYPNHGWDDYKELACYILNTPLDDMLLRVVPSVGSHTDLTFQFIVPVELPRTIRAYDQQARTAWFNRAMDWKEAEGLPDWMDEWVAYYNRVLAVPGGASLATSWRECLLAYPYGASDSEMLQVTQRTVDFHKALREDYALIEPLPDYHMRTPDIATWAEDDPLKPYALAAIRSLEDLRRTVGVRDQDINAFGLQDASYRSVSRAPVAGYPSGAMGNQAPKELAEVHRIAAALGKGNLKRGLQKILATLEQPVSPKRVAKKKGTQA